MANFKRVYICSPLNAETAEGIRENADKARLYMKVIGAALGCRAVAPHAYLAEILDDKVTAERLLALEFGMKYLSFCDALVVVGDMVSSGMEAEIEMAKTLKIPVIEAGIICSDISAIFKGVDRFAR